MVVVRVGVVFLVMLGGCDIRLKSDGCGSCVSWGICGSAVRWCHIENYNACL